MVSAVVAAILVFIVYLSLCLLMFRWIKPKSPLVGMGLVFIVCLPLIIPLLSFVLKLNLDFNISLKAQFLISGGLIFTFLCFGYSQIHGLFRLSLTIQILLDLLGAQHHTLSFAELSEKFKFEEIFKKKISRTVHSGMLEMVTHNGAPALLVAKKWQIVTSIIYHIKKFLKMESGG